MKAKVTEETAPGREPDEELTEVVRELSDRIETLQADVRRLGAPGLPAGDPGWSSEDAVPDGGPSYLWVSSLGAPVRRRPGIPRVLLEVIFLAGVATAAALAELDAPVIAAVMAGSWVLVALIEWAASRAERARNTLPRFEPAAAPGPPAADPSWFVPPVEQTLLEPADSPTAVVARLPPPADELDTTLARPPES